MHKFKSFSSAVTSAAPTTRGRRIDDGISYILLTVNIAHYLVVGENGGLGPFEVRSDLAQVVSMLFAQTLGGRQDTNNRQTLAIDAHC